MAHTWCHAASCGLVKGTTPVSQGHPIASTNTPVKYLAAYLLLTKSGNSAPSKEDITKVLEAAGIDVEDEKLDKLIAEVDGKTADELIAQGQEKLSTVSVSAPSAASGPAAAESGEAEEEEKEEEAEESDDDMGMGLFD
ncbi:DEKNAAC103288 [Brettanomyces naardenensis]|uniref:DEKNAAC103289 n=1 Tax=Brettanomyces naardenensis TaxID=13370 RepID=A0A448YMU2_BRENA|nr:DEKNAAC103288 [Brettanomyces naardenensis]